MVNKGAFLGLTDFLSCAFFTVVTLSLVNAADCGEARTFGHRQVEQLIEDRPSMVGVVIPGSPASAWCVSQFNSGYFGSRIHWDNTEPQFGTGAECIMQADLRYAPPCIRISSGREVSGKDKWISLIYELENIRNEPRLRTLKKRAYTNAISEDEFVRECQRLEFQVIGRIREHFSKWREFGESSKTTLSTGEHWVLNTPTNFDQYLKAAEDGGKNVNRKYFVRLFRSLATGKPKTAKAADLSMPN